MKYQYNKGEPVIIIKNPNLEGVKFERYLEEDGRVKLQVLLPKGNDFKTNNVRIYDVLELDEIKPAKWQE